MAPPISAAIRPDFFIVGAPKCGTTALTEYLRQHPQVGRILKEVHYFGSDLPVVRGAHTEQEYLGRFKGLADGVRAGDASVFYLHSLRAAQEIKAFEPAARIIVMVRNPADMLHSLHSQFVFVDSEDITDFEAALEADEDRVNGHRRPLARVIGASGYLNIARYTEQLRRYFDAFGRDRVHTIVYDDFAADPLEAYAGACDFLGLDSSVRPIARVVNPNKTARSKLVRRVVEHPPPALRQAVHVLPSQRVRRRLSFLVKSANTRYEPREAMSPGVRERLNAEFASEVEHLSELLGRDLTSWTRG